MPQFERLRDGEPCQVGAYQVLGRLGSGGQGIVFLAESPAGSHVALKVLHPQFVTNEKARRQLAKEVAAARKVDPFCTARLLDAELDGAMPFLVSEFIDGPSLRSRVQERGPLREGVLDRLAVGTATALASIHRAGVVHRDLKPSNVLLGEDGPRVIDFGIARDTDVSTMTTAGLQGSPPYMAPECLRGAPAGPEADVFAWGCVLVYAATGNAPFGTSFPAVLHRILNEEPDLGPFQGKLRQLAEECLDKDPARRPTAEQILHRLIGPETSTRRSTRRNFALRGRLLVLGSAASALLLLTGYVLVFGVPGGHADDRELPRPSTVVLPGLSAKAYLLPNEQPIIGSYTLPGTGPDETGDAYLWDSASRSFKKSTYDYLNVSPGHRWTVAWSKGEFSLMENKSGSTFRLPEYDTPSNYTPFFSHEEIWSPDGNSFVAPRYKTQKKNPPIEAYEIYRTSNRRVLGAVGTKGMNNMRWTQFDGVLVRDTYAGRQMHESWLVKPNGEKIRRLSRVKDGDVRPLSEELSPNGSHMFTICEFDPGFETKASACITDLRTGKKIPKIRFAGDASNFRVDWLDKDHIYGWRWGDSGSMRLVSVRVDGTEERTLVHFTSFATVNGIYLNFTTASPVRVDGP